MPEPSTVAIIAGQLSLGGAERQLYLWLSNLDRDRFRPVVMTLHPGYDDYWEHPVEALGIDVIRMPRRRNRARRLQEIVRALRDHRPDLIHGWHLFASPYAGAAARVVNARASLGSVRGSFQAYQRASLSAFLTRLLTDGLVVNSATVAAQIRRRHRLLPARVFAVPNAVEPLAGDRSQVRARLADRWNVPVSRTWIASVGRFEKSKRFDLLIELTASLANEGQDLHLILIGYGEGTEELKTLARALAIENRVTFTGADAEARLWMNAFDVFCFTSTDEGLPNVVMEAAAAGLPVLAWRTGFLTELLSDGQSAVLVEPGDIRDLRAGLLALIANPGLRSRLGEEARREIIAGFGLQPYVRRLSDVYEELLKSNRRALT